MTSDQKIAAAAEGLPDSDIDDEKEGDAQPAAAPPPGSGKAILGGNIEILPDKRLHIYDRGPVKAYEARSISGGKQSYFALVCENNLVPRIRHAGAFTSVINASMATVVKSGIVFWPSTKEQRYVFIYENNLGRPLLNIGQEAACGWKIDHVMSAVVRPMVSLLLDIRDADLVHGSINPTNMFDGGSEVIEKVILGEGLCLPPSCAQPALYEPISRAMADPVSRGLGTIEDDLYSLGVSLAVLLRHKDPLEGLSDDEVVLEKIEQGSYAALIGKERFTGSILELLRGLLYDDRAQRWTLDEIMVWMEGQRLSPKQLTKKAKAARPLQFGEERFFRPAVLAMEMDKNHAEAMQLVEGGALEQWLERSLEDVQTGARYEQAVETAQEQGRGPGYWDRLLSRVSIALDPEAPIRFKGMRMHPDGIPYALADTFCRKGDLSPFVDIINEQLVTFWLTSQYDLRVDVGTLITRFDSCRAYLRQMTIGYGIERCLYFLNREAQCMSEKLKGFYVRTPEEMMFAFEEISARPDRPELFIDRHIAAFLSVKDRKSIDGYFIELNSEEFYKRILGNIRTLATIQKRSRMGAFPGITAWVAAILEPVYERYHDRSLRDNLRAKVEKLKTGGDITKIALLFDDVDLQKKDFDNFRRAMAEYAGLREEKETIEKKMKQPSKFGRETGREVAAIVACFISGIIILAFAFLYLVKSEVF